MRSEDPSTLPTAIPPRSKLHCRKHSGEPSTTHKQAALSSSAILDTSHGHGWPAAKPNVTSAKRSRVETPGHPDIGTKQPMDARTEQTPASAGQAGHAGQMSGFVRCRAVCVGGAVFERGTEV